MVRRGLRVAALFLHGVLDGFDRELVGALYLDLLFRHGAQALSSAELVEILLRNGCPCSTARNLARELIIEYGSLIGLSNLDRGFLQRRGIGEAKAATIIAAFEIARRVAWERMPRRDLLDRPDAVASYLSLRYAQGDQETMGALYLDVRNRLIGESEVYLGTLSRAAVEPRAIFKEALLQDSLVPPADRTDAGLGAAEDARPLPLPQPHAADLTVRAAGGVVMPATPAGASCPA